MMQRPEGNAFDFARYKLYLKQLAFFVVCIGAGCAMAAMGQALVMILVPFGCSLIPMMAFAYYLFMFRTDRVGCVVCTLTEKKHDIAGGLYHGLQMSRHKYVFEYETAEKKEHQFTISRGGMFNTLTEGGKYLVLYRKGYEPSRDNFIEYIALRTDSLDDGIADFEGTEKPEDDQ